MLRRMAAILYAELAGFPRMKEQSMPHAFAIMRV
jgi:hypothetical protein